MGSRHTKNWKSKDAQKKINDLRRKIKALKAFPLNFRDADPNSRQFHDVLALTTNTEDRQRMKDWMKGPILYIHPITKMERSLLGPTRVVRSRFIDLGFDEKDENTHFHPRLHVCTFDQICLLMDEAAMDRGELQPISFIYIKNIPYEMFQGLNAIAKYRKANYRFKAELTTEQGHTPGL